jgi:hypothetical protein
MQRNTRVVWHVTGAALTAVSVLAVPVSNWTELIHLHGSSYTSAPLPGYRESHTVERAFTLTSPTIVVTATGRVNVTLVAGHTGQFVITREITWYQGQPDFAESWDGRTLEAHLACARNDRPGGPSCKADYTLSVPIGLNVKATSPTGTVSDLRPATPTPAPS